MGRNFPPTRVAGRGAGLTERGNVMKQGHISLFSKEEGRRKGRRLCAEGSSRSKERGKGGMDGFRALTFRREIVAAKNPKCDPSIERLPDPSNQNSTGLEPVLPPLPSRISSIPGTLGKP
nr:hypothetical protein CFP56_24607 [Quercus suber]